MGYLKGRFQSLRGLRQKINSEQDFCWALAWVRVCLIIHSLAAQAEVVEDDDFWDWVRVGLENEDVAEPAYEVEGFHRVQR